jgi:mutator protein MutT
VRSEKAEVRSGASTPALPPPLTPLPSIEVSAGLVFRADKLLITQRHAGAHLGGLWEFPGGKREPGESIEDCLVRELREELGIEVAVGELIETLQHDYPEKRVLLNFFRCEWRANEPQAIGCPAFAWVTREELCRYEFPAADTRLLERLRSMSTWWSTLPA